MNAPRGSVHGRQLHGGRLRLHVQPALVLRLPAPAPVVRILAGAYRRRARAAADARVAALVQRIRRDLGRGRAPRRPGSTTRRAGSPSGPELVVPLDDGGVRAVGRLVAPDRRHPRVASAELGPERQDLAPRSNDPIRLPGRRRPPDGLVRSRARHAADADPVARLQPVPERVRLGKSVSMVNTSIGTARAATSTSTQPSAAEPVANPTRPGGNAAATAARDLPRALPRAPRPAGDLLRVRAAVTGSSPPRRCRSSPRRSR